MTFYTYDPKTKVLNGNIESTTQPENSTNVIPANDLTNPTWNGTEWINGALTPTPQQFFNANVLLQLALLQSKNGGVK